MKICVSGVHGVGKSTLVRWIGSEYKLTVYPEMARSLLDSKYPFEEVNSSLSVFMDFQNEVLDNQTALLKEDDFVTDRSPLDSLAYVIERLGAERYLYAYYYESYKARVEKFLSEMEFDAVFFIEFTPEMKEFWEGKSDGQRNLSPMYMKALNDIMWSSLSFHTPKNKLFPITSNVRELNERKLFVKGVMNECQ